MKRYLRILEQLLPALTILLFVTYGLITDDSGVIVIAVALSVVSYAIAEYLTQQPTIDDQPANPAEIVGMTISMPPSIIGHLQARRYNKADWTDDEFAWFVSLINSKFTIQSDGAERDSRS